MVGTIDRDRNEWGIHAVTRFPHPTPAPVIRQQPGLVIHEVPGLHGISTSEVIDGQMLALEIAVDLSPGVTECALPRSLVVPDMASQLGLEILLLFPDLRSRETLPIIRVGP